MSEKAARAASFVVIAPLITARLGDKVIYLDRGSVVPAGVAQESIVHLLSVGLIAESA